MSLLHQSWTCQERLLRENQGRKIMGQKERRKQQQEMQLFKNKQPQRKILLQEENCEMEAVNIKEEIIHSKVFTSKCLR